jgi:hypothetical protein
LSTVAPPLGTSWCYARASISSGFASFFSRWAYVLSRQIYSFSSQASIMAIMVFRSSITCSILLQSTWFTQSNPTDLLNPIPLLTPVSCNRVATEGVWIGNWIYCTLENRNYS